MTHCFVLAMQNVRNFATWIAILLKMMVAGIDLYNFGPKTVTFCCKM